LSLRRWMSKWDFDTSPERFLGFFQRHGHGIQYLDLTMLESYACCFRYGERSPCLTGHVKIMTDNCPSLRHIVVGEHFTCKPLLDALLVESRRPVYIDVWMKVCPRQAYRPGAPDTYSELLSNPRIRILESTLCHLTNLPVLFTPWDIDTFPLIHRLHGMCLIQTPWCIFRDVTGDIGDWDGEPGTLPPPSVDQQDIGTSSTANDADWGDSDSDYCPSESPSSESCSSNDDESEGEPEADLFDQPTGSWLRFEEGDLEGTQLTEEDTVRAFRLGLDTNYYQF